MRRSALLLFFSACLLSALAQNKLPAFGKVDRSDLELRDCDFDPGAEAMVLIDFGEIQFSYAEHMGWISESIYRVRIKVLKEKGVNYANIKLPVRTKDRLEEITNVRGISVNLSENGSVEETTLEKNSIFEKNINKEYGEISFAIPNVKVGTVFEYRYKMTRRSYSHIPTWTFQQTIPVRYSAYNILVPEYFEFSTNPTIRQHLDTKHNNPNEKGAWYIMQKIPGLKEEPYSSGREDFLQWIEFQLAAINMPGYFQSIRTTWKKIIDEMLEAEEFGGELRKNIRGTGDLSALLVGKTPKEKIRTIFNHVQKHMTWDGNYGFVTYDGIKSAWDRKNGSLAEINLLLVNLLKDAGLDAKPLLTSTREHGIVNSVYPFLNDFNGVMAYLINGNDLYVMNAADKFNSFNQVPYDVAHTLALIVDRNDGTLINLPATGKYVNNIFFTCNIENDGKIAGHGSITGSGYARHAHLQTGSNGGMREIFEGNSGIVIRTDSITVNNRLEELLPLEHVTSYTGSLEAGGAYFFLPFNLFTGIGKNPFLDENRVTDIDFLYPRQYVISGTYFLPEGLTVTDLPRNTRMIMPDTSMLLSRKVQLDANVISFRLEIDIRVLGYGAESYPYVKDFFKKMYGILDEKIVLKKK